MNKCNPVIKWAGGKRQLLNEIKSRMPASYKTYYEPFFGGGALFFDLCPSKAVINDFNSQLINLYEQIRTNTKKLMAELDKVQSKYNSFTTEDERKDYYYEIRTEYNKSLKAGTKSFSVAAQLIFLNKTGFNGLYRVNSKGEFNTPFGYRKNITLYDVDNIKNVSKLLKKVKILNRDFEEVLKDVSANDFVFLDSPYYGTFDTYQSNGFSEDDHKRLCEVFKQMDKKGAKILMTNSNTEFIKELYKGYNIEIVPVKRMINRDGNNRTDTEVIIMNYKNSSL